ncbi:MAG TPA: type IV pilin protein [Telluria sp.]|jgi:type IV pilus assembly protein PilE|nr:type IV pilin protein [Telluria sp.]
MNQPISRGFTLIELMMAVAIVGVLAAIAYPTYTDSIRKSNRASAKAKMTEIAQREGVFYSEATAGATYTTDLALLQYGAGTTEVLSETKGHSIKVAAGTGGIASSYTITATALRSETDACKSLTLDHLGTFGPAGC